MGNILSPMQSQGNKGVDYLKVTAQQSLEYRPSEFHLTQVLK